MEFKLRRLNALLAVHDTGSTLKAADTLHMSQPAVAAAIAGCERDAGTRLFERSTRGMRPTRAGEVMTSRVRTALSFLAQVEAMIRPHRGKVAAPLHRQISEVHLRALMAVVDHGGFAPAARRLGISQPTLHRAARELEGLCGVTLWSRAGIGVDPTPEGHELVRLAALFFKEIHAGFEDIRELQGVVAGELNVGGLPLARSRWLPTALAQTLRTYPQARIHVMDGPYDDQLSALRHGRIDVIMGALRTPVPVDDIVQEHLFSDPWLILVRPAHPFAAGFDSETDKLTPAQLDTLSWILPRRGAPGREIFESFMVAKGVTSPSRVVECSSFVTTRALLMQSDHAAILSRQQVEGDVSTGSLKIMGPPLTGSARPIGLTTRKGFVPTRLQQAFLDTVRQHVADTGLV